jgi:hypothetical protein
VLSSFDVDCCRLLKLLLLPRYARVFLAPIRNLSSQLFSQASAAARIAGRDDIWKAAEKGDFALVRDHVTADPASVHKQGGE